MSDVTRKEKMIRKFPDLASSPSYRYSGYPEAKQLPSCCGFTFLHGIEHCLNWTVEHMNYYLMILEDETQRGNFTKIMVVTATSTRSEPWVPTLINRGYVKVDECRSRSTTHTLKVWIKKLVRIKLSELNA